MGRREYPRCWGLAELTTSKGQAENDFRLEVYTRISAIAEKQRVSYS